MAIAKGLMIVLAVIAVGALAVVLAGQTGLLQGTPPSDLGVRDGRLKPPSASPNSVSSQAALYPDAPQHAQAQIDPLPLRAGDGPATIARLKALIEATPGATVVKAEPGYLYAQYTTRLMKYVDDLELWFDPAAQVVQVRSASRLGQSDLGANRARVEALRAALAVTP